MREARQRLPAHNSRAELFTSLASSRVVVVSGETGCGKSTQVPQYLHEAGWTAEGRVVACLQPRRVAAVSVAQRVAAERGCAVGEEVGYAIRFESQCSELRTRIKYMTEGVLIREMMRDPLLSRYSVVMLDEAHERTVFLDVVVGLLAKVQRRRPDLRVIVSSATLDAETFRDFFNTNRSGDASRDTAAIFTVEGRTYPVEVMYAEAPVANYLTAAIDTVVDIDREKPAGDILVFLTGRDEVESAVKQLRERLAATRRPAHVLPLHGALPAREQFQVGWWGREWGEGRAAAANSRSSKQPQQQEHGRCTACLTPPFFLMVLVLCPGPKGVCTDGRHAAEDCGGHQRGRGERDHPRHCLRCRLRLC